MYLTKVVSADGKNGNIEEVNCIKTKIENDKAIDIENSSFKVKANSIIFAIGLVPNERLLEQNKIKLENGLIKVDENSMTNLQNVFAGGDLIEAKSTVCKAIATGKKVAKAIIKSKLS